MVKFNSLPLDCTILRKRRPIVPTPLTIEGTCFAPFLRCAFNSTRSEMPCSSVCQFISEYQFPLNIMECLLDHKRLEIQVMLSIEIHVTS